MAVRMPFDVQYHLLPGARSLVSNEDHILHSQKYNIMKQIRQTSARKAVWYGVVSLR